jgi:hypothetical protein
LAFSLPVEDVIGTFNLINKDWRFWRYAVSISKFPKLVYKRGTLEFWKLLISLPIIQTFQSLVKFY